mgnify:CR=1 FL=1
MHNKIIELEQRVGSLINKPMSISDYTHYIHAAIPLCVLILLLYFSPRFIQYFDVKQKRYKYSVKRIINTWVILSVILVIVFHVYKQKIYNQ